jgi:hypothetical protein
MPVSRGGLLIALLVPLVVAADAQEAASPLVEDPCGDNNTWLEAQFDRVDTTAEGEAGHDIEAVWIRTRWVEDPSGEALQADGIELALDLCADVPDPERPKTRLYVSFSVEGCHYTADVLDDLVVTQDPPGGGVARIVQARRDCDGDVTTHDVSASTRVEGDLISWTFDLDDAPTGFAFEDGAALTGIHGHTVSAPPAGVWINEEYGNVVVHNDDVSSTADFTVGSDRTD